MFIMFAGARSVHTAVVCRHHHCVHGTSRGCLLIEQSFKTWMLNDGELSKQWEDLQKTLTFLSSSSEIKRVEETGGSKQ